MILAKARQESRDFYEVLDYYLELIRNLHKKTYAFLSEKPASTNPIMFMQGGLLNGYLKANEKIGKLLPPMTMSFGITALNELQELYNGKSIVEDGQFAIEVMEYINKKANEFKKEDHILYAIYGTPKMVGWHTSDRMTVYRVKRDESNNLVREAKRETAHAS